MGYAQEPDESCGGDRVRSRSSRAAKISSMVIASFSGSVSIEAAATSSSQVFSSRFGLSLSIVTFFLRKECRSLIVQQFYGPQAQNVLSVENHAAESVFGDA